MTDSANAVQTPLSISRVSPRALLIRVFGAHSEEELGCGTGFVVRTSIGYCLVTARHVVTGRHHFTGCLSKHGGVPTRIRIYHRASTDDGAFRDICLIKEEALYTPLNAPRWFEYPKYGRLFDFVVLPLSDTDGCQVFPVRCAPGLVELSDSTNHIANENGYVSIDALQMRLHVGQRIAVIGFPFGMFTGSGLPLWATGHFASEPELRGAFSPHYIDCRARPGQSGSPVYVRSDGELPFIGGNQALISGSAYSFVGLYSGRINEQSDIGIVWAAEQIDHVVQSVGTIATAEMPNDQGIGSGSLPGSFQVSDIFAAV